jgi:hypothetical protein
MPEAAQHERIQKRKLQAHKYLAMQIDFLRGFSHITFSRTLYI